MNKLHDLTSLNVGTDDYDYDDDDVDDDNGNKDDKFHFVSQCAYVQGNISEMAGLPQCFQEYMDG